MPSSQHLIDQPPDLVARERGPLVLLRRLHGGAESGNSDDSGKSPDSPRTTSTSRRGSHARLLSRKRAGAVSHDTCPSISSHPHPGSYEGGVYSALTHTAPFCALSTALLMKCTPRAPS